MNNKLLQNHVCEPVCSALLYTFRKQTKVYQVFLSPCRHLKQHQLMNESMDVQQAITLLAIELMHVI